MPTRQPVPSNYFVPGGTEDLVTSGSDSSAITQDWWVHVQTIDVMYLRNNQYNLDTSTALTSPIVEHNYLDVRYTVQTTDEIYLNATFSGERWEPQTLEVISQGASAGGFGVCGAVNTSTVGYIRRAVRKDSQGNILDPTGVCTYGSNTVLDQIVGPYNHTYDTSTQVNANLQQLMGEVSVKCPEFIATLVAL